MLAADGLAGPIVVHPKEPEPFEYDEERVIFLSDFFSQTGQQQEIGLENIPFTWVGNPDSLLINGKGIASACVEGGVDFGNPDLCLDTCNDALSLLPAISVEAGKTYRLRIINGYVRP
jgi:FtsP/CotA-like multicopper oxidase with cupredoxin domain